MSKSSLLGQVAEAVSACQSKKAEDISILQMDKGAFTDYLVLCHGTNPRQVQAIVDEVELRLKRNGIRPNSVEGYSRAEWVLLDYVDFVVQVFDEERRRYYDLDRLWKRARHLTPQDLKRRPVRPAAETKRAAKAASRSPRRAAAKPRRAAASRRKSRVTSSGRKK
jgi:ribosome-associated protein